MARKPKTPGPYTQSTLLIQAALERIEQKLIDSNGPAPADVAESFVSETRRNTASIASLVARLDKVEQRLDKLSQTQASDAKTLLDYVNAKLKVDEPKRAAEKAWQDTEERRPADVQPPGSRMYPDWQQKPKPMPTPPGRRVWSTDGVIELWRANRSRGAYSVVYGLQCRQGLSMAEAIQELGNCLMHHLTCEGRLDRDL